MPFPSVANFWSMVVLIWLRTAGGSFWIKAKTSVPAGILDIILETVGPSIWTMDCAAVGLATACSMPETASRAFPMTGFSLVISA